MATKIPSPQDCGLPEKFSSWRASQEQAIDVMLTSQKRVIGLSAPTGFGKSPTYVAYALLSKKPTCIVTNSRGLQDQLMCLAPDTRVCTSDLRWIPLSDVRVGRVLLAFDEHRNPNRRLWQGSVVLAIETKSLPCYSIRLSDGTGFVSSQEHPWLTGDGSGKRPLAWKLTCEMTTNDYFSRVLDIWEYEPDFDTGYLAAAFNGEGHLHQSKGTHESAPNGMDVNLSFAQVTNVMLQEVKQGLTRKGFKFTVSNDGRSKYNKNHKDCNRLMIGGRANILKFLGQIRPSRLLSKLDVDMLGMMNPARPVQVESIIYLGKRETIGILTTSHTFVAEGFASHNSDYSSIGMVDIRGRSNYRCAMREDFSCREGHASMCPYKGTVGCPSSQAEMRAATSSLVVTNYDKWTSSRKYGMGMSHFEQVIFDEGHDAPDALARAMQIYLSADDIEKSLELDYPIDVSVFGCWRIWATNAHQVANERLKEQYEKITEVSDPKPSWIRQYYHLRDMVRRLSVLSTARSEDWVVDEVDNGFQFDPIRPARYSEAMLLLRVPRIIVVSATLRPKTLYMLGIGKTNFDFVEFSSDFDPKRCPIYWVPTMRVDSKANDLSMLWMRLDQIAARRRDRKGIIHTISYARRDEIISRSRFAHNMMVNTKGEPPTSMVDQFKRSAPGTILVSPSVGTGYDFPGKDCEWQFLCKIPFPDGRSKIIKARQEEDKEYGAYIAMQTMVQSFGRGMRSKEDHCENFIGDDHMSWFLPRYGHLAPKSFHGFYKKVDILPQPPEKL